MDQKFYICKRCGNIIAKVKDVGVPVVCCGEPMSELVPGTTDAAVEKHVPVWTVENGIVHVKVGSVEHPMLPEHYIEWVSLQTKQGNQRKELHPGEKPEVCFALCEGDEVEAEESDQAPVDGSDDCNGECGVIQSFHVKKPPFSGFCIVFLSLPVSL